MGDAHERSAGVSVVFILIILFTLFSSKVVEWLHVYYITESSISIVMGVVIGGIAVLTLPNTNILEFNPNLFFFVLLPPIVFEAGFSLKRKQFFKNIGAIVLFAVLGTLISTIIIGMFIYKLSKWGIISHSFSNDLAECLVFGVTLSAIDPVSTLAILGNKSLRVNGKLYSLVFGESVLNDAVCLVLFNILIPYVNDKNSESEIELNLSHRGFLILIEFLAVFLASLVLGCIVGLLCTLLLKHMYIISGSEHTWIQFSVVILFAYASYSVGEVSHLSGIVCVFFEGIITAHYSWYHMSLVAKLSLHHVVKALAKCSENFVYFYLGVSAAVSFGHPSHWSAGVLFSSIALCVIARFFNIFPLSAMINIYHNHCTSKSHRPDCGRRNSLKKLMSERKQLAIPLSDTEEALPLSAENSYSDAIGAAAASDDHTNNTNNADAIVNSDVGGDNDDNYHSSRAAANAAAKKLTFAGFDSEISWEMQFMLWFAGARGAVSFAMCLNLEDTDNQKQLVTSTILIVLLSTVIIGAGTLPILKKLDLQEPMNSKNGSMDESSLMNGERNDDDENDGNALMHGGVGEFGFSSGLFAIGKHNNNKRISLDAIELEAQVQSAAAADTRTRSRTELLSEKLRGSAMSKSFQRISRQSSYLKLADEHEAQSPRDDDGDKNGLNEALVPSSSSPFDPDVPSPLVIHDELMAGADALGREGLSKKRRVSEMLEAAPNKQAKMRVLEKLRMSAQLRAFEKELLEELPGLLAPVHKSESLERGEKRKGLHRLWHYVDKKYLIPLFGTPAALEEARLQERYSMLTAEDSRLVTGVAAQGAAAAVLPPPANSGGLIGQSVRLEDESSEVEVSEAPITGDSRRVVSDGHLADSDDPDSSA